MGWLKKIDGRLQLANGSKLPRDGSKTTKDAGEALNTSRPGIIPMSKIQDKSNLYQRTGYSSSYLQACANASKEDEDMKIALEFI